LWLVALVVVGLVFAAGTLGAPGSRGISVLLAAFLGALATLVFTEWRQARQRVSARMGYARLLVAEIEANEPAVKTLDKHRQRYLFDDLRKYGGYTPPSIEVWPEISVKLAPLIEADEFALINDYYRQLRVLVDLKEGRALRAAKSQSVSRFLDEVMNPLQHEARRLLSKHANPPQRVRWLGVWW